MVRGQSPEKKEIWGHRIVRFCLGNSYFRCAFSSFGAFDVPRFSRNYPPIDDEYFFFIIKYFFFRRKKSTPAKKSTLMLTIVTEVSDYSKTKGPRIWVDSLHHGPLIQCSGGFQLPRRYY